MREATRDEGRAGPLGRLRRRRRSRRGCVPLAPPLAEVSADVRRSSSGCARGGDDGVARYLTAGSASRCRRRCACDPEVVAAAPGLLEPEVREALRARGRATSSAVARAELEAGRPAVVAARGRPDGEVRERAGRRCRRLRAGRPRGLPVLGADVLRARPGRRRGVGSRSRAPPGAAGRPTRRARRLLARRGGRGLCDRAAHRRSPPWPSAPRRSRRWTSSPGPGNRYVAEAKRQLSGDWSASTGSRGRASW